MLLKFVPCKLCEQPFKRNSRANKLCESCRTLKQQEQAKIHTITMRERATRPKPKNYTVVNTDERFLGFLVAHNDSEAKKMLKRGQKLYRESFGCNYY